MKNLFIIVSVSILSTLSIAKDHSRGKTQRKHREHQAHQHGAGTLAIAFEGKSGKIEFKAAAESVLGFESKPTHAKQEKIHADVMADFENQISKMIQFASSLNCKITKEKIEQVMGTDEDEKDHNDHSDHKNETDHKGSGAHSDWLAQYTVSCDQSPVGTSVVLDLTKYKKLKDVDVTLLADQIQKSAEYKGRSLKIEIK